MSCRSFYSRYFFKEFVLYHKGVLICCRLKNFPITWTYLKISQSLHFVIREFHTSWILCSKKAWTTVLRGTQLKTFMKSLKRTADQIIYYTNVLSKSHAEFKEYLKSQNVEICQCWKEFLLYRSLFLRWLTVFLVKENDQTYFLIPQTQESLTYIRDKLLWTHSSKFLKQNIRKLCNGNSTKTS